MVKGAAAEGDVDVVVEAVLQAVRPQQVRLKEVLPKAVQTVVMRVPLRDAMFSLVKSLTSLAVIC